MKKWLISSAILLCLLVVACKQGIVLASVVPDILPVNGSDQTVQLYGKNFIPGTVAVWNDVQVLDTVVLSGTTMTAVVPTLDLTQAGVGTIRATNNQTASAPLTITIGNIVPTLSAVAPDKIITNASSLSITVTGTNFNSSSVINWNGSALPTTFVSATSLTATIPTSDYASAGVEPVTVSNPGTGGGTTTAVNFTVVAPLVITTASLPGGSINTAYSATLAASGGFTPLSWSITQGSLPVGLSLNASTGGITGTPTQAGSASFTVTVMDSYGSLATKRFGGK